MIHPVLMQTVLDAPDYRALARFYLRLLGADYRPGSEEGSERDPEFIEIEVPGTGARLAFQASRRHRAPDWPGQRDVSTQAHLDFALPTTDDLDAAGVTVGDTRSSGHGHCLGGSAPSFDPHGVRQWAALRRWIKRDPRPRRNVWLSR